MTDKAVKIFSLFIIALVLLGLFSTLRCSAQARSGESCCIRTIDGVICLDC